MMNLQFQADLVYEKLHSGFIQTKVQDKDNDSVSETSLISSSSNYSKSNENDEVVLDHNLNKLRLMKS